MQYVWIIIPVENDKPSKRILSMMATSVSSFGTTDKDFN